MSVISARAFGTIHTERIRRALAAILLVAGCTAPLPPTPSASPSDGPTPPPSISSSPSLAASASPITGRGAALHVSGLGHFDCQERRNYGGCEATFAVKPAPWEPDEAWQPLLTDGTFTLDHDTFMEFWISGAPSDQPAVLEPGRYALVGSVIGISDVLNPDGSWIQTGPFAICTDALVVTPATRDAWVQVHFEKGGESGATCSIDAIADDSR
ncbi:MAG: hypothetical protein QOH61_607 [Chloroflexota bacterium]|jgi:hypothetical protein|nr:hypothetical protein [Chloroflexota bacterium]